LYARIVRDANKLAGLGWTGVIRDSYYHGFRHPLITKRNEEEIITDAILCDVRYPNETDDFEKVVKQFVLRCVYPFISKNNLQSQMLETSWDWVKRYAGVIDRKGNTITDPIIPIAQKLDLKMLDARFEFIEVLNESINETDTSL